MGEGLDMTSEEIWRELGSPACVATKYYEDLPQYRGIFSPTISFQVTPKKDLEGIGYDTFEQLIEMSTYGTAQLLKNFRITRSYEPYYICGCRFYEFDSEYLFEHIEIDEPLKAELKTLKAEHNGFYYDFNCHQSSAQNQVADREFEAFKKTIQLL